MITSKILIGETSSKNEAVIKELNGICFGGYAVLIVRAVHTKRIPRTNSRALQVFSSIASFVFHPLAIVTYVLLFLYNAGATSFFAIGENLFLKWLAIIFLSTVFLPFVSIAILRLTGLISDAFMHAPKDRVLPLVTTLIFYSWTFYYFEASVFAPLLLTSLLLGAIFSVILDFFINFFYKVSVHTTAAAMLPGNMIVLAKLIPSTSPSILLITIILALLVGLVRWWLGAHTLGQIILGYVIGTSMQILAYFILR